MQEFHIFKKYKYELWDRRKKRIELSIVHHLHRNKKNNNYYYVFSVRTPDSVPLKYTSRGDGHLREHGDQ